MASKKHYKKQIARLKRKLRKTTKRLRKLGWQRGGKSLKPAVGRWRSAT